MLTVPDPNAWQQLPTQGISPAVLPQHFSPALRPAFVSILEAFYALEYRQALEKCGDFMNQLITVRHELGANYDTTVRCYSILRLMIHVEMGFYLYPTDLPYPDPPHLDAVPDPKSPVSDAYVVHRLLSASFDTTQRAAAGLEEHGWTYDKSNAMVKNNISFFKQALPRFKPKPADSGPVPDLHIWFWVYFLPFIMSRQVFLSYTSSLKGSEKMFAKIWPMLVSRLSAQNRPELVFQLCRKHNQLGLDCFSGLLLPCQALLNNASTRFEHVAARHVAVTSCVSLIKKGKLPESSVKAELEACADICKQSGLIALSADLAARQHDGDFEAVTRNSDLLESLGHYDFAHATDAARFQLLVNRYDETVKLVTGDPARRILKDMFDRESFLMGKAGPRNGHHSYLFDKLTEWSEGLLLQREPSITVVSFVATFIAEAHQRAVKAQRAPPWEVGQKVLQNALELLSRYACRVYLGNPAPRFLWELLVNTAWNALQDARRLSPKVPSQVSYAVNSYLGVATMYVRWGDRSGLARRLESVEFLAETEIANDMKQRAYANAVTKCAAITMVCLYHPERVHMRSIRDTGTTYNMACNLLANDALWENNETGRAQARAELDRAKGAWIAWTDSEGRYREPGSPRRVPGEPEMEDFWTYDWTSLALVSDLWQSPALRQKMISDQTSRNMQATMQGMSRDQYLKDCIEKTTKIFNEPSRFY
ncbi:hypothetical protein ACJ41O_000340 [Fusarium nematophilum]